MRKYKIGVLGGGSFGTAISHSLSLVDNEIDFWMRRQSQCDEINLTHENSKYAGGFKLKDNIIATSSLEKAVKDKDVVFVCIPSKNFREVAIQIANIAPKNTAFISCTKGMEPETLTLMSDVLKEELKTDLIGVLSGPNLAKEIMQGMPSGTVIASENQKVINITQDVLSSEKLRVYANKDRYGVELGGTLKNIYAIATGLVSSLGYGANTQSLIMTRGISEISRYSISMGADPMTFVGLAGVGDLIATCSSPLSRNYRVGYQLGEGKTLQEIIDNLGEVAEGVNTIRNTYKKVKEENLYMPMVVALYQILFENKEPLVAIRDCMVMDPTHDVEFSVF
jgi:glycerol-3-phosphate dehydrogenase (NAD(P)+)